MGNHHHHFASCSTTKEGIRQNYTEEIQNGKTVTEDEIRLLVPITAVSLERKSDIRRSLSFIFLFLALETSKQMSNFALAHSNDGHYPVPSSLLVALAELVKLLLVFTWAKALGLSIASWTPSIRFSLPAICYCLTNLMYMNALTFISPPIWMVLIQTRTLYTAVAYKVIFNREVTCVQALGCVFIVVSISVARFSTLTDGQSSVEFSILCISQLSAMLSTAASIAVELLLKNDERSFCEQQWWLYVWGSFLGIAAMMIQEDLFTLLHSVQNVLSRERLFFQLILSVGLTSLAGMCVPVIVRNLDTIVKDYLSAANNLVLSVVTALIFPLEFKLSWLYLLSLGILATGIWLYEKKTLWQCSQKFCT